MQILRLSQSMAGFSWTRRKYIHVGSAAASLRPTVYEDTSKRSSLLTEQYTTSLKTQPGYETGCGYTFQDRTTTGMWSSSVQGCIYSVSWKV